MSVTIVTEDLAPIVPDGENPTMVRRAFQRINDRVSRLRSNLEDLVSGEPVVGLTPDESVSFIAFVRDAYHV